MSEESDRLEGLPEASRPFVEGLIRRNGRLLSIHVGMAASPPVIAAYAGLNRAISDFGTFDARTREAIALAVGNQNGCDYCQAAHTVSARRAGLIDDEILQIRSGEIDFDERLAAITDVARNAAAAVGYVNPEIRVRALQLGWTEQDLAELFAHVTVSLFTNYFNHYAGTELDFPAARPLD